jgi:nicotinic acid mononucleotide adenylyltransferase
LDISSRKIRSAIKVGDRIDHLVPKVVMDYIYGKGLYR